MGIITWKNLPKSQDDDTTIEEEIEKRINNHNNDQNAHRGEDKSLEIHKEQTPIDHKDLSITLNKLTLKNWGVNIDWKTLDYLTTQEEYGADLYVYNELGCLKLRQQGEESKKAEIRAEILNNPLNWEHNPTLTFKHLGTGYIATHGWLAYLIGAYYLEEELSPFAGVKLNNNGIYAVWRKLQDDIPEDHEQLITTEKNYQNKVLITIKVIHPEKIEIYIDGELKYTITENLPWENDYSLLCSFSICLIGDFNALAGPGILVSEL